MKSGQVDQDIMMSSKAKITVTMMKWAQKNYHIETIKNP